MNRERREAAARVVELRREREALARGAKAEPGGTQGGDGAGRAIITGLGVVGIVLIFAILLLLESAAWW